MNHDHGHFISGMISINSNQAYSEYLRICCFAVVGLITSVISDSFMASQQREQKSKAGRDGPVGEWNFSNAT